MNSENYAALGISGIMASELLRTSVPGGTVGIGSRSEDGMGYVG
jgi:hypothetical protein